MAKPDKNLISGGIFEVDQSNRVEDLSKDSFIAITRKEIVLCIKIPSKTKRKLFIWFERRSRKKLFGPEIFARAIVFLLSAKGFLPARLIIDVEYTGYEDVITRIIKTFNNQIEIVFNRIGKNSTAHLVAYSFRSKRKRAVKKTAVVEPIYGTSAALHPEFTGIRNRTRPN